MRTFSMPRLTKTLLIVPLLAMACEFANAQTAQSVVEKTQSARRKPDVVFVPTPQPVVDKMLEMAEVKKGDVVYDLGCGDGRIVVTAAKKYGVKAVGFDIDPKRIKEARERQGESSWSPCGHQAGGHFQT